MCTQSLLGNEPDFIHFKFQQQINLPLPTIVRLSWGWVGLWQLTIDNIQASIVQNANQTLNKLFYFSKFGLHRLLKEFSFNFSSLKIYSERIYLT